MAKKRYSYSPSQHTPIAQHASHEHPPPPSLRTFACLLPWAPSYRRIRRNKGRWTNEEHQGFLRGLDVYGRNWDAVTLFVPTRTALQIRTHSQKYFAKTAKGRLFPEEVSASIWGHTLRTVKRVHLICLHSEGGSLRSPIPHPKTNPWSK